MNSLKMVILLSSVIFTFSHALGLQKPGEGEINRFQDSMESVISEDYNAMISSLKKRGDANSKLALGVIYMNGIKEKNGDYKISPDPLTAERYFNEAIVLGAKNARATLAGLYIFNPSMRKLDPDLEKAEKLLKEASENKEENAENLLASLYIEKNDYRKAMPILLKLANEKNDADAQFTLALIFKKGVRDENGGYAVVPDEKAALYYLNMACHNPNKSEKLKRICFDPRYVVTEAMKEEKKGSEK